MRSIVYSIRLTVIVPPRTQCNRLPRKWFAVLLACVSVASADEKPTLVRLETGEGPSPTSIVGRIAAKNDAGQLLLEEASGRLHSHTMNSTDSLTELQQPFQRLTADEMAAHLLKETGAGFRIHRTDNFLICSDASDLYTDFCSRLLQKVATEYHEFFEGSDVRVQDAPADLPVIIFRNSETFQAFAKQQHPTTDFSDVPGYYSVRDNQTLIAAVSGDREFRTRSQLLRELRKNTRQIETIVHEAIHQLAFNTGLQVRYADNPLWLSEGLAVYFEHAARRGAELWTQPGGVNRIHLPGFKAASASGRLRLPLSQLISSDAAFRSADQLADAYAESWALTYYLVRSDRQAFDRYLSALQNRKPLETVDATTRLREFEAATGTSLADIEERLVKYMSRVRVR